MPAEIMKRIPSGMIEIICGIFRKSRHNASSQAPIQVLCDMRHIRAYGVGVVSTPTRLTRLFDALYFHIHLLAIGAAGFFLPGLLVTNDEVLTRALACRWIEEQ
jgi:hypothetical protein